MVTYLKLARKVGENTTVILRNIEELIELPHGKIYLSIKSLNPLWNAPCQRAISAPPSLKGKGKPKGGGNIKAEREREEMRRFHHPGPKAMRKKEHNLMHSRMGGRHRWTDRPTSACFWVNRSLQ